MITLLKEIEEHLSHSIFECFPAHREAFDYWFADEGVRVLNGVSTSLSDRIPSPEELVSDSASSTNESGFFPVRDVNLSERHAVTSMLTDSMPRLESDCQNHTQRLVSSSLDPTAR